jgi:hypothetical protein
MVNYYRMIMLREASMHAMQMNHFPGTYMGLALFTHWGKCNMYLNRWNNDRRSKYRLTCFIVGHFIVCHCSVCYMSSLQRSNVNHYSLGLKHHMVRHVDIGLIIHLSDHAMAWYEHHSSSKCASSLPCGISRLLIWEIRVVVLRKQPSIEAYAVSA